MAAGPSNGAADLRADPHLALRNLLIEVPRPDADEPLLDHGNPVKLSPVAEGPVSRFPRPGQHTDELLREAGISDDETRELRNRGVV